ncbi:MAG: threonine/serine ThrE exporter family protein [Acidaminococcaceae bacterium]
MTEKIMKMSQEEVLNIALTAGKILLISGAETYRVEDTIIRLCAWRKMGYVKVFVTPTVIIIGDEKAHGFTCMTRVTARTTNLSMITAISDMSYAFGKWSLSYQETKFYLEELRKQPVPSKYVTSIASGIASACFAVMLGGNFADFGAAFLTGFAAMLAVKQLAVLRITSFWENALAGMIIAFVALTCCQLNSACTQEKIIVGAIMPFLPGVAFTNGLRDFMAGDLLSGNSRIAEAFLFAAALALGIAVVLRVWLA